MSQVFIAWSGNKPLAELVKDRIEKHEGYDAVVGGDDPGNWKDFFVGSTILHQMNGSDQAIFLIQNRVENNGQKRKRTQFSANLMYELGYIFGQHVSSDNNVNNKNIHTFFIDLSEKEAPSDIQGTWIHVIATQGKSADDVADEICRLFIKDQKRLFSENKLTAIIDHKRVRSYIIRHNANPSFNNFQMALYIICYMYSAYIFPSIRDSAKQEIEDFRKEMSAHAKKSKELYFAVECAMRAFNFFKNIRYDNAKYDKNRQFLGRYIVDFPAVKDGFELFLKRINKELKDGEVKTLLTLTLNNFLSYAYILRINCANTDAAHEIGYSASAINYAHAALADCERALNSYTYEENREFCMLIGAYVCRNLFLAYGRLESFSADAIKNNPYFTDKINYDYIESEKRKYLEETIEKREELYNQFAGEEPFFANISMEYHLSLAEKFCYTEGAERSLILDDLKEYLNSIENKVSEEYIIRSTINHLISKPDSADKPASEDKPVAEDKPASEDKSAIFKPIFDNLFAETPVSSDGFRPTSSLFEVDDEYEDLHPTKSTMQFADYPYLNDNPPYLQSVVRNGSELFRAVDESDGDKDRKDDKEYKDDKGGVGSFMHSMKLLMDINDRLKARKENGGYTYFAPDIELLWDYSNLDITSLKSFLPIAAKDKKYGNLTFALGVNENGGKEYFDLAKAPHILMAGFTGSGVQYGIYSLILSLIYNNSPEELKLVLADNGLTLGCFDKLPHLLVNEILGDRQKVLRALGWCVKEMESRYGKFHDAGVRNIDEYNSKSGATKLPKIVFVVAEYEEYMTDGSESEFVSFVIRLLQKSRAAGIHIILATQRPSRDVVSDILKANMPARMAFRMASAYDSRNVLDENGAELLTRNEMLFMSADYARLKKIKYCYVDDMEVIKVADYVREKNEARFNKDIADYILIGDTKEPPVKKGTYVDYRQNVDRTYLAALEYAIKQGRISVTMLQKKFSIGYSKGCRILDWMEDMGFVSEYNGGKPSEVYLTIEEFEEMFGYYGDDEE